MKFSGILIGSENPTRLKEYYTKLFGKPTWDEGEAGYFGWQFGDGGVMMKGEFEKLKKSGATVVKEPYDPGEDSGMTITTFSDPDNNYFQLMSPMDAEAYERAKEQMASAKR
jgi:hypothetical protein